VKLVGVSRRLSWDARGMETRKSEDSAIPSRGSRDEQRVDGELQNWPKAAWGNVE
jgi:hypothetical protein